MSGRETVAKPCGTIAFASRSDKPGNGIVAVGNRLALLHGFCGRLTILVVGIHTLLGSGPDREEQSTNFGLGAVRIRMSRCGL